MSLTNNSTIRYLLQGICALAVFMLFVFLVVPLTSRLAGVKRYSPRGRIPDLRIELQEIRTSEDGQAIVRATLANRTSSPYVSIGVRSEYLDSTGHVVGTYDTTVLESGETLDPGQGAVFSLPPTATPFHDCRLSIVSAKAQ